MLLITTDRLLCVLLNIKYNYYITLKVIKSTLICIWLFGVLCFIPSYMIFEDKNGDNSGRYTYYLTFDGIFVFIAVITYSKVSLVIMSRKRQFNDQRRNTKFKVIPFVIIGTFILFYIIPDVSWGFNVNGVLAYIMELLYMMGSIADPLTYIFLHEKTRNKCLSILHCRRTKVPRLKSNRKASTENAVHVIFRNGK